MKKFKKFIWGIIAAIILLLLLLLSFCHKTVPSANICRKRGSGAKIKAMI